MKPWINPLLSAYAPTMLPLSLMPKASVSMALGKAIWVKVLALSRNPNVVPSANL